MIIDKIIRYFTGNVRFEAVNGFSERLINLCSSNEIKLRNFIKTPGGFRATVSGKNYQSVREFAKKANVDIKTVYRRGFWYKADKYKNRFGFLAGASIIIAAVAVSQCFVWDVSVEGNERVRTDEILTELEGIGVKRFAYLPDMDLRMKKQEALLRLPGLSWLTINRNGSKLKVQVSERHMPPKALEDAQPCDIIAGKTGHILYMEVYDGTRTTGENYTVQAGDVIVAGSMTDKKGVVRPVHAAAKVIAQVQLDKSFSIDINQFSKVYGDKIKTRRYLCFGSIRLPLFIASEIKGDYDVVDERSDINMFGYELPIGILSREYRFYSPKSQKITLEEGKKLLSDAAAQYENDELRDSVILSRSDVSTLINGVLTMKIHYTTEEDIAVESAPRAEPQNAE